MLEFYEPLRDIELQLPSLVIFGIGTVTRVGQEAKRLNAQRVLIVTDPGVPKAGLLDRVREPLLKEGLEVEVWDEVEPEPSVVNVEKLLDFCRSSKFDLLVALGGGSSMDVAKAVAVLLNNPGAPEDYFPGGKKEFTKPGIPCIAIPTTAGTGAEATWDAVIKDRTGLKTSYAHPFIRPSVAIVDPIMSLTMPPKLTASTGIDALSHAIESTLTRMANPITQALALQAIRLISRNLRTAVFHGNNIEARYNMALATLTGALSETNAGDIEAHAFGHLIGSVYRIPHGTACGIVLPYAMEYNLVILADRLKLIAEAMGEDVTALKEREAAYKGIYAVRQLIEDVGLPTTLKEVGVKKEDIPGLAETSVTSPWITVFWDYYTFRKMTKENATELLERMWEGRLGKQ